MMSSTESHSLEASILSTAAFLSNTDQPLDDDQVLQEIFENTADRFPHNIAIRTSHSSITYGELELRANQIANALINQGVVCGDHVGLVFPRSEDVYAVMLGILKCGAAYVPIDSEYPQDRIAFIAKDCQAKVFVTTADQKMSLENALVDCDPKMPILTWEELLLKAPSGQRIPKKFIRLRSTDLSYIIYTSGTTGRPKGCQIEHRNICALIKSESEEFGFNSSDVIFQGFSLAFDASLEEIWAAFAHGAALFVGTKGIMQSGHFLANILAQAGVTVLSCVPTLLSMLDQDIPTVRILIFGGETCPPGLVARWHHPDRVIYNTYGPTETTVVATFTRLEPNQPVTIGRPLKQYSTVVVDETLNMVADGQEGELIIGGAGVARGYLNRPELNDEKFISSDRYSGQVERYYRSGDLVKINSFGDLEFLGRADDQIKIRGFRVELTEIESLLLQCPGILAAAAGFMASNQQIAAYVVGRANMPIDRAVIQKYLQDRLPHFMVPAYLDELEAIPTMTSGKVDRKRLPAPRELLAEQLGVYVAPTTELEHRVLDAWLKAFSGKKISVTDNFFMDLGGHSLLAALVTNQLRSTRPFETMGVADIYARPTIQSLAAHFQNETEQPNTPTTTHRTFHSTSNLRYFLCGTAQAIGIVPIAAVYAWEWLGPYFVYAYLTLHHIEMQSVLLAALATYFITIPATMIIGVVAKWTILGRIKPGHYPLWGVYYFRYWFVRTLLRTLPVNQMAGTPLLNFYYRFMGAKIGEGVYLGTGNITTYDTITVGHGSSVGGDSSIDGAAIEDGWLKIRNIHIGNHCTIGHRSVLGGGNKIENGGQLEDLSALPTGAPIGRGQRYGGSPARHVGPSNVSPHAPIHTWNLGVSIALGFVALFVPLMVLIAVFPGLMLMTYLQHIHSEYYLFWGAPFAAISFVICLCLLAIIIKWTMIGKLSEGVYPIASGKYVRKWLVDHLLQLSLEVTGTLYATLYLRPFLKLLGAKIGPRSEISTVRFIQPDLLIAGEECFLADDVSIGAPRVANGWIDVRPVHVGHRTFIGNGALLPGGTLLADQVLIGVLSRPPQQNPVPNGTSWLGSVPMLLPKRQEAPKFADSQTYQPSRQLVALRYFIEFFRVILPSTLFIVTSALILKIIDNYHGIDRLWLHLSILPFVYLIAGAFGLLIVVAIKWIVIGRYRPGNHPLWSHFVWRSELVTGIYENFGVLFILDLLRGTPFLPMILRLFGMKIGKRCYFDSTWFTEFDLIKIGSDVILNEDANIQTHLFEDRVLKLGRVKIGRRCGVGTMSTVLYDSEMKHSSKLGDLSLLMKGEVLPASSSWSGSPLESD